VGAARTDGAAHGHSVHIATGERLRTARPPSSWPALEAMAVMELVAMELAITLHGRMNMADSAGRREAF